MTETQWKEKYGPGVHSFITNLEKSRPLARAPYIVNILSFKGKKVVPLSAFWKIVHPSNEMDILTKAFSRKWRRVNVPVGGGEW